MVLKIRGEEAWGYDTLCILCRGVIPPGEEVYVVGAHVFHPQCLERLLSKSKPVFEEMLKQLPLDTHEELKQLYEERQKLPPRGTGLERGTAREGEERGRGESLSEVERALRHREGKKPFPPEIEGLAEVVRGECRSYEELLEKVRYVRARPYSRISAIVFKSVAPTLRDVCEKGPSEPRYTEIGILYHDYVAMLGVCGKSRVTVYRAGTEEIRPGDWVYIERERAEDHAEIHGLEVFSKEVPPDDVVWAGTSPDEWFYIPKELQGYWSSLEDFWKSVTDPSNEPT